MNCQFKNQCWISPEYEFPLRVFYQNGINLNTLAIKIYSDAACTPNATGMGAIIFIPSMLSPTGKQMNVQISTPFEVMRDTTALEAYSLAFAMSRVAILPQLAHLTSINIECYSDCSFMLDALREYQCGRPLQCDQVAHFAIQEVHRQALTQRNSSVKMFWIPSHQTPNRALSGKGVINNMHIIANNFADRLAKAGLHLRRPSIICT